MNTTPHPDIQDDQSWAREIKYMLGKLSLKQKINAYHAVLYLQWREGLDNENGTPAKILHGAWVFHTRELRDMYRTLRDEIGKPGIAAMLGVVAYCLLIIAKVLL